MKIIYYIVLSLCVLLAYSAKADQIQLHVLKEPSAATFDGKNHLVYELVITNASPEDVTVSNVAVDGKTLGTLNYTAEELQSRFQLLGIYNYDTITDWLNPGIPATPPVAAGVVPAGRSRMIYLQLSAEKNSAIPTGIDHIVTTSIGVYKHSVKVLNPTPIVLGAPFSGGVWFPFNAPSDDSRHRRSVIRLFDQHYIAQRYAIDWMKIGQEGFLVTPGTSSKENKSYASYFAEIIAVSDATVEAITDDIPENIPDDGTRAVTINMQTITGNSVILKLGENRYAVYAHLVPGSLKVKVGQNLKKGDLIGALGNSGNSTAPHLHFHVCDGPSALQCQGIPYVFEKFKHQEMTVEGEEMQNLKFTGSGPQMESQHEMIWNYRLTSF